ncbi:MAG TPA: metallophosphoesterase [Pyrinomonadaceae bacterium]|nr:metallophosphoesterase [Pyrinomonadaceae bacterium]
MAETNEAIRTGAGVAAPRAAAAAPAVERTDAPRLRMVGWYDPRQLARTGVEVAISTVFGRHSDFRIVEALSSGEARDNPRIYDYTCHYIDDGRERCEPDPARPREEIWIDYVGDVGDGWNSTYAVAYNLAQPARTFRYKGDGRECAAETRRGDVLVFGGDQVYPTASRKEYEQRLVASYRTALPYAVPPPHAFAIPGNHDWYDSLVSFTRLFSPKRWVGGWRTRQSRSYFALKLPHGWWLLGTDVQLGSDIDAQQVEYFERVADLMDAQKRTEGVEPRIILCHAEPHWVRAAQYADVDPNYSESNLLFLERKLGAKVAVFLAGDLHHYRRHQTGDGATQKITAGGGGAFLHPTHYGVLGKSLDAITEEPPKAGARGREFRLAACFPPKRESSRLCWRNLIFPYLKGNASWTFGLVTAALYLLTTLSVLANMDEPYIRDLAYRPGVILSTVLFSVLGSHATLFWVLLIWVGFVFFTDTHSKLHRFVLGSAHAYAHVIAAFAVALVSASFVQRVSSPAWVRQIAFVQHTFELDLRMPLAGLLILLGGFVFGSLVMGAYLLLSLNFFGRHANEAFSSIAVEDWKNFLRLHIDREGTLTIYPVGIRRVPRRWKDNGPGAGSEVVPDDERATEPELIEPPVVLRRAGTETGVAAGDPSPRLEDCGPAPGLGVRGAAASGNGSK